MWAVISFKYSKALKGTNDIGKSQAILVLKTFFCPCPNNVQAERKKKNSVSTLRFSKQSVSKQRFPICGPLNNQKPVLKLQTIDLALQENYHSSKNYLLSLFISLFMLNFVFNSFSYICCLSILNFQSCGLRSSKAQQSQAKSCALLEQNCSGRLFRSTALPLLADLPLIWTRCFSSKADVGLVHLIP